MYKKKNRKELEENPIIVPTYGSREMRGEIPRYELPETSLSPVTAYNVIKDELVLDGNTRQNLATTRTSTRRPPR